MSNDDRFILKLMLIFVVLFAIIGGILAIIEINKQNNCFELLKTTTVTDKNHSFIEQICR